MSDTTTEPAATEPTEPAEAATQGDPVAEEKAPPRHVPVAELAEERARRKELQQKLDEIEKAQLSDLERAQAEATEAREAAAKASAEALRFRIAAKHNISDEDADLFLTGSDEETLTRQAARLIERAPATSSPKPDLTQGGKGEAAHALNGDPLLDDLKSKLGIS